MKDDRDKASRAIDAAAAILSEHFSGFVVIGEYLHENGDRQTPSRWAGGVNTALGLAERAGIRIKQRMLDVDLSSDEEDELPEMDDDEGQEV